MRSLAVSIERNFTCCQESETEPYEAGWASEARWFVHVFNLQESAKLKMVPQISLDGLFWCDYTGPNQEPVELSIDSMGLQSMLMTQFGQWLRLRVVIDQPGQGDGAPASFNLHLVLKG